MALNFLKENSLSKRDEIKITLGKQMSMQPNKAVWSERQRCIKDTAPITVGRYQDKSAMKFGLVFKKKKKSAAF